MLAPVACMKKKKNSGYLSDLLNESLLILKMQLVALS